MCNMPYEDKAGPSMECRWDIQFKGTSLAEGERGETIISKQPTNPLLMSQKTTEAIFPHVHTAVGGQRQKDRRADICHGHAHGLVCMVYERRVVTVFYIRWYKRFDIVSQS